MGSLAEGETAMSFKRRKDRPLAAYSESRPLLLEYACLRKVDILKIPCWVAHDVISWWVQKINGKTKVIAVRNGRNLAKIGSFLI